MILVFGLIVIGMLCYLQAKDKLPSPGFFKMFSVTLVLTVGLNLIVAGYNQEQIATMMGLLGSVVGYILGGGEGRRGTTEAVEKAPKSHSTSDTTS